MGKNQELKELINEAFHEQERLLAGLPQETLDAIGEPDAWATKDQIAHVVTWKTQLAERLDHAARGETPPAAPDYQQFNDQQFLEYRHRPWNELLVEGVEANRAIFKALDILSEEDLTDPDRYEWNEGRALWHNIAGTGYLHAMFHLSEVYQSHGQMDAAEALEKRLAETGMRLYEGDLERQGIYLYNLACFYAKNDMKDMALPRLDRALKLNPGLTEWSRQDPDLEPLHGNPDYEALYPDDSSVQ